MVAFYFIDMYIGHAITVWYLAHGQLVKPLTTLHFQTVSPKLSVCKIMSSMGVLEEETNL